MQFLMETICAGALKPPPTQTLPTTYWVSTILSDCHFVEDFYFAKTETQTSEGDFVACGAFLVFHQKITISKIIQCHFQSGL